MPFNRAPADIARSAAESEAPWAWDGLVSAWPLLGRSGTRVSDYSAYRKHGELVNITPAQAWKFDVNGPILEVLGNDDAVDLGPSSEQPIVGATECTLAAWARIETGADASAIRIFTLHSTTGADLIFGVFTSSSGRGGWILVVDDSDTRLQYRASSTPSIIPFGTWVRIVAVWRGGSDISFYVDGFDDINNMDVTNTGAPSSILSANQKAAIAGRIDSDGTVNTATTWPGQLQDVRIYNRAWTPSEVKRDVSDSFALYRRKRTFIPVSSVAADITGSGSPQAGDATAAGTAERVVTGTTTVQAQNATVTGTGDRVITDQSSTVQAQPATASGSGTVGDAITGSGSAQAQDATATATGEREITGQGTPQAQAATATGVGERIITGAAAVQADPANASGTDTEEAFKAKLQPGVNYARLYSYIKG